MTCATCNGDYLILGDNGEPTHCPDCDKTKDIFHGGCVDCNREGTKIIAWTGARKEGPYVVCDMCSWHSVKNRGATDLGTYPILDPVADDAVIDEGDEITEPLTGFEKDWDTGCMNCDQKPTVGTTGLCGPCCFGEADTIGGNW